MEITHRISGAVLLSVDAETLAGADLSRADLYRADLAGADLSRANLAGANLSRSNLVGANMAWANLAGANLFEADLSEADLSGADLSGADGLVMQSAFLRALERDDSGFLAYKTFGQNYPAPESWSIQPGGVITENCCTDRTVECGCGINVATARWIAVHTDGDVWKVRIPYTSLVIVPYHTDGQFRCETAELIEIVSRESLGEKQS